MTYSNVLTAAQTIPRASPQQMAIFQNVPVGNIVDANGRNGAMNGAIRPITKSNAFVGSALCVNAGPNDNLAPWAALRVAEPGDAMVITTSGHVSNSVCGDIFVGMARNAGVVAIVTDGVVRDISSINRINIPVFAVGVSANSPQKNGPGEVGLPIVAGDIAVRSGDVVCGDEDGVVVIASERIAAVSVNLEAVRKKESEMERSVDDGAIAPSWLNEVPLEQLFTYSE